MVTPLAPQQSFDDIVRELSQPILRYLQRYTGDPRVAEDLRQETLLRVSQGLASFKGESAIKTWVLAIATRVAAEYFRDPKRKAVIVELDQIAEPADPAEPLDERAIVGEMSACIRGVIDSLPDIYRAPLILHELEELSVAQTAAICGCSESAVKIRIHRARARLREALKRQCDFYPADDGGMRCDRKGDASRE